MTTETEDGPSNGKTVLERVTIRFAGDSGDGVQITGSQFSNTSAIVGNDLATFPDFPAEIRAPAGTLAGVSGFQVQFASQNIHTPGDQPDVLVAFNPAALRSNLSRVPKNGVLIINTDTFEERELKKAGYDANPLEDGSLDGYQTYKVGITSLTLKALEDLKLTHKEKERCKNFFALGLLYWLYSRPMEPTLKWFSEKFAKKPQYIEANSNALKAGFVYGEATEVFRSQYEVPAAEVAPGTYRNISGNTALALGLIAACHSAGRPMFYGSYPITPASDILHELAQHKNFDVVTFQAEDEIAAVTAAIGAAFAGSIAVTGTSGPGVALKSEAIGLAIMVELPLVICDVQRGGPSTGLPTKTEQADLLQAMFGRNSDSPAVVLAPCTPSDCFDIAFHAVRIATHYMIPVFVLSDGYLANGAEPWRIPKIEDLPKVKVQFRTNPEGFEPYLRDDVTLARPWVVPGTPAMEHRIGGLEKSHIKGNISYDADNHDFMVHLRAAKVQRVVREIPDLEVNGADDAKILLLGWGSTYGSIRAALEECRRRGLPVAHAHLRFLNPFPANLGKVLSRYEKVLIPELNMGQLLLLIRSRFMVDAKGINKVAGQPFRVDELIEIIEQELKN